jgi:hypothetical protein
MAQVLDALTFVPTRGNQGNLLPNVQTIVFEGIFYEAGNDNASDELFASMVESRWWPDVLGANSTQRSGQVSRLTSVGLVKYLHSIPRVHANALKRIEKLREEGLDVVLE